MTNSITITVERPDGTERELIIQAEHHIEKEYGIEHATSFTIWTTVNAQVGYLIFSKGKKYWKFEGQLSESEQKQITDFIISFKESDWEL